MLTPHQLADRMALIREVGNKFKQRQNHQALTKRRAAEVVDSLPVDEDETHWTDNSKYANDFYGEAYRATVRFDDDWD